jgi:DNA polymerase I-like protein with 3'-5' exonuclease and polymerase domains
LFYKDKIDVKRIRELLYQSILVGANLKFDLAWMERLGIDTRHVRVLDIQLAEFLLSDQTKAFPSLDYCSEKYLEQKKIDKIKLEYWEKGIDTWFIPEEELTAYLKEDLRLTWDVWARQRTLLQDNNKIPLFRLQCADLVVLNNMEWNGIPYNKEESIASGEKLNGEIEHIRQSILSYTSCPSFNTGSGDHLSCLLYGGIITHKYRIPNGVYKTGKRVGEEKFKIVEEQYEQWREILMEIYLTETGGL